MVNIVWYGIMVWKFFQKSNFKNYFQNKYELKYIIVGFFRTTAKWARTEMEDIMHSLRLTISTNNLTFILYMNIMVFVWKSPQNNRKQTNSQTAGKIPNIYLLI